MGDTLDELLERLAEHAAAAIEADKTGDAHRQAIRDLLPQARKKGAGPAELERTISSIFVSGTISRWTKDYAPADRKGPGRRTARKAPARPASS
jgi:hypothetical protein